MNRAEYFKYDALLKIATRCRDSNNISDIDEEQLNLSKEPNVCVDWDIGFMLENEKVASTCADLAATLPDITVEQKLKISNIAVEASILRELAEMENQTRNLVREELEELDP